MAVSFDSVFGIHAQALKLRSQRGEVLASNLVNADTPDYKARDIDFSSALKQAQGAGAVTLATTQSGHLKPQGMTGSAQTLYRIPNQPSLDGNTVDSHVEQAKFAENAVNYQATLRFLNGKISTLMAAIKGE
jgi:flagellar basal-body rod protein FlgB